MRPTELAVPAENTVRALRRLAPGARLREPPTPELRVLAGALRDCAPPELARAHPRPVARVVLAAQLRMLDRATTGFFDAGGPESARLVRAARFGRVRPRRLLDRLATEPGLRTAALVWAEVLGHRILAGELRGVPEVPAEEDGRLAAELAVAALLPRAEPGSAGREVLLPWPDGGEGGPRAPGGGAGDPGGSSLGRGVGDGLSPWGGAGGSSLGRAAGEGLPPWAAAGGSLRSEGEDCGLPRAGAGGCAEGVSRAGSPPGPEAGAVGRSGRPPEPGGPPADPGGSAFLRVRSVRVTDRGFRVDVHAEPPVELLRDGDGLTLRALWWNGLDRVADDLGHEYLLLARDHAGTGTVRHWCHPRPAPGARVLRLESAGYRGERVRLDPASAGTCAEVLVKCELTVRLGA
ncbi:hypothetical protein [Amycolatopsis sp. DG1A-15b]|uniref:hypothetical protein n=1 Tax=Amycolatopsis sp. DG1A-15b TaxID=3052846 RepID=UPI00255C0118|nr:hypothetical protein [Amycolatopsis sp. DG1A-15b]WIX85090.1 hypothetical protein QRY02_28075 [Amycolatopsis sp. DG1A-15b]